MSVTQLRPPLGLEDDCPDEDCRHREHPGDTCLAAVYDQRARTDGICGCRPRCDECHGHGVVEHFGRDHTCKGCGGTGEA